MSESQQSIPTNVNIIRFIIGEKWTLTEMAEFLWDLNFLYSIRLFIETTANREYFAVSEADEVYEAWERLPYDRQYLVKFINAKYPNMAFKVHRLQYSSPGFTDFVGIGAIVGHIKDFFLKLIEYKVLAKKIELEAESIALENQRLSQQIESMRLQNSKLKMENALEYLSLTELVTNHGLTGEVHELRGLTREAQALIDSLDETQNNFIRLLMDNKIRDVEVSDSEFNE